MLEVMACVLLCILEAVEGALCLPEVLDVPEAMRCMLLCMLEAVEGALCLQEMLEVMRCVLLCMLERVEDGLFAGYVVGAGGAVADARCATLYAGGPGG